MAEFQARFYRVTHCGYYRWGQPAPDIGGADFILRDMRDWSVGKSLLDTKVEGEGDRLPAYLLDIKEAGGCWVLTIWNEVPAEDGAIASVPMNALVGGAVIFPNPVLANSIPGFPTYFLFIPAEDLLVTLRYSDSLVGLPQLKHYFVAFLERSSSVIDLNEDDPEDVVINGYVDELGVLRKDLRPGFAIQLKRGGSQEQAILQRAALIRSVIRVSEIEPLRPQGRDRFQRALDWIGVTGAPPGKKVRIRQEMPVKVTRAQLAQLIDSIADDLVPKRNDLAFKFERDPKPYWLSGGIPHGRYDVAVARTDGVFPAEELAVEFSRIKRSIVQDANP